MHEKEFKVKPISSKNSFLFLSDRDYRTLDPDLLIRLSYGLNKRAYFSLGTSLSSLKEGELALCSVLAKELGIFKNDTVTLSSTAYVSSVKKLNIQTASKDDYDILEILAENVQDTLLNQVRVVHNGQKLVIWVSPSLHVTVDVDGVTPISPGKLEYLTEVAILPPEVKQNNMRTMTTTKKRNSGGALSKEGGLLLGKFGKFQRPVRLHPFKIDDCDDCEKNKALLEQPFNVFLSLDAFSKYFPDDDVDVDDNINSVVVVNLRIISAPSSKEVLDEKHFTPESIVVRILPFPLPLVQNNHRQKTPSPPPDILYVNDCIFNYFRVPRPGCKALIESCDQKSLDLKSVEIIGPGSGKLDELVRNYFVRYCQDSQKFLVNPTLIMKEPYCGCEFFLKFNPPEITHLVIDSHFLRSGKLKLGDEQLLDRQEEVFMKSKKEKIDICLECCNFGEILENSCNYLLKFEGKNHIIITGKTGSGKSTIALKIAEKVAESPHFFYVEVMSCRALKGKNVESMHKTLQSIFLRLIYYQPSVLILDDLNVICERVVDGEAPTPESLQFTRISELLADELENITANNEIYLIATAESVMKLNRKIYDSRGIHLFPNVLNITEINLNDRKTVLSHLFERKSMCTENMDIDQLARNTESFIMQDLIDLVDKIIFEAYKEVEGDLKIAWKHCEKALENCCTLALRDVKLHSPGERDFSDIGGLEDVKSILVESLLWPALYPEIFSKAPLRLQSGILLYGPPGTGKTIMAGAAAKQCNLRLISVKGPELLSKYIGASEQSVRDIFQKAQSAKPCILFFDEFDSLAPRRGHDNTGVTDRVVNQFLTQLDGVESLNGVCVLAATSRPDLLDPALLRPGRLDRQILCPMPDQKSRLDILRALSKKLNLHPKINLEDLSKKTEGFSGADLQAVLYTAQLNSVEHLFKNNQESDNISKHFITQKHLSDALRTTRPSLSKEEKAKYDFIYGKFQGKGDVLNLKSATQKITLA